MALENIIVPDDPKKVKSEEELKREREEAETKRKAEEEAKIKAEEEEVKRKAEEEGKRNGEDETPKIEIDGVIYTVDDNGNAVDDSGNIKFTKEQIDSMESQDGDDAKPDNYIDAISKVTGIVLKDDKGNILNFESTVEGFAQREVAVKALGEKEGFDKGFKKFLESNPDIASIIDYKNKYGTVEGYSSKIDYSKIEIKNDESLLSDLIYKAEIQKGTSPERAKRIVEFAKANNSLKEDATESLEWLRKNQEAEINRIRQEREAAYREEIEKEIKFYGVSYEDDGTVKVHNAPGSLYDIVVNKGVIGEYSLPKEGIRIKTEDGEKLMSREEIFEYFAKPVTEINGIVYSQAQLDEIKRLSNPAELAMRFIMNLNGGVDQLVKNAITKTEIKRLKSLSSTKNKNQSPARKTNKGDNDRIVLPIK